MLVLAIKHVSLQVNSNCRYVHLQYHKFTKIVSAHKFVGQTRNPYFLKMCFLSCSLMCAKTDLH